MPLGWGRFVGFHVDWTWRCCASYPPVFSQVHSPLLPALLCTSENYVSQAPLPAAGGWESLVRSIHLRWSPELGKHSWLSSCSPPCLLHGSNNCRHILPSPGGPRSWPLGILVSFQPREGKGFLLMLNLGSSPFPTLGILAIQLLKQKTPCIKSPLSEISSKDFAWLPGPSGTQGTNCSWWGRAA